MTSTSDTSPRAPALAGQGRPPKPQADAVSPAGQFLSLSHTSDHGTRAYKLYVPSGYGGRPVPLIVMLHGCAQSPDDFAAGTRMNDLADQDGFLVAYPAQTARENGARCWNWFDSREQGRDGGEPSFIAGIVRDIGDAYDLDSARVFVAGLSAGAAMAVIVGAAYPDVFAGVAAHSGLPVGAASNMFSALSAMRGGRASFGAGVRGSAVPTIVFHGDADDTVVIANGAAICEQALTHYAALDAALQPCRRSCGMRNGKKFSTTNYVDAGGNTRVEDWVVHGGSHAWSGGSAEGSYTDASGPNASAEIVRFFLAQNG